MTRLEFVRAAARVTAATVRYVLMVAVVGPALFVAAALGFSSLSGASPVADAFWAIYSQRETAPDGYVTIRRACTSSSLHEQLPFPIPLCPQSFEVPIDEAVRRGVQDLKLLYLTLAFASSISVSIVYLFRRPM